MKKINLVLTCGVGLLMSVACSPGFQTQTGSVAAVAASTLAITPSSTSIQPYAEVQLTASGGKAPYTYSVTSGSGTIGASTGLFIAPSVSETDTVTVIDTAGSSVIATVTVSTSASSTSTSTSTTVTGTGSLSATYSPSTVYTGDVVTIEPSGGIPPYTYTLSVGSGTLSGDNYTAAATAETVVIDVSDSGGNNAAVTFSVTVGVPATAPANSVIAISALSPQTTQNECPSGGTLIGTIGAMYGSNLHKYAGDSSFCETVGSTTSASQILSDLYISPMGLHQQYATCPGGYETLAQVPDCGGGYCGGYQSICASLVSPISATTFVSDFYITTENVHANATCSAGYTSIGSTTDCGGGSCVGTQALCVKH